MPTKKRAGIQPNTAPILFRTRSAALQFEKHLIKVERRNHQQFLKQQGKKELLNKQYFRQLIVLIGVIFFIFWVLSRAP
jgi:hypothetical protein